MNSRTNRNRTASPWLWQLTGLLLIASSALLLTGCFSTPSIPATPIPQPPPAQAMVPCQLATRPDDPTLGAVAYALDSTAWTLSTCRAAHKQLTDWVTAHWSK
ncbi:Rz1-like lysis system protein LysC [Paraburkholderia youngii]|uniref:Rz1-like lysis system protein LysC n=1 Tax=Paraburkholderia youngii TaxID=2782701 RepID=UPI00403A2F43